MEISIHRTIHRTKHPYMRRYSSTTYFFAEVGDKKITRSTSDYSSYQLFINAVKKKYGEGKDVKYNIDHSKPYVHYL